MANSGLPPGATLVSGSLPSQPADATAADTSVATPSAAAGLPPGATLVSGIVPTPSQPAAPAPASDDTVWGGVKAGAGDIYSTIRGMVPGGSAETGALKTIWDNLPPVQLMDSVKQTLPLIHAYETARSKGSSMSDALTAVNDTAKQHIVNISSVKPIVDAFHANPTRETARALTDAAALAASLFIPGAIESATPEAAEAAKVATTAASVEDATTKFAGLLGRVNPFRSKIIQKAVASPEAMSEAAAQPVAQSGVQAAAPTVGASLRSGIDVQTPFAAAKNIYQTVDEAAKTNFKVLYEKLDAAQDEARLAASGSPEEAKAQLNVKNTQDAIGDAKAMAAKSDVLNVDKMLAQADAKFAETQANKDFNSKFFGNQGVIEGNVAHGVPEKINVDKAIDVLENMDKPNKYGISRLQQTSLGKDGAFKLKQYIYDAQKAGQTALNARVLRNTILKWGIPGIGSALGLGYELTK